MRKSLLLGAVCFLLSAAATYAVAAWLLPPPLPAGLLGTWRIVDGEGKGTTVEFFPDGSMVGTVQVEGHDVTVHGRARVEGNGFHVTTPGAGGSATDTQEILELNERWFATQDARGGLVLLERRSAPARGTR